MNINLKVILLLAGMMLSILLIEYHWLFYIPTTLLTCEIYNVSVYRK